MNFFADIQELNFLEELHSVFYRVKDPGTYSSDKNVINAIDEWLHSKGITRERLFHLLYKHKADDVNYACILGVFFHYGIGVQVNRQMAFNFYQHAAKDNNDAFAQNRLGYCYRDCIGTTRNLDEAFKWFKKSAEGGHMCGMRTLAEHYYDGLGCEKNSCRAFFWYSKAYINGNPRSIQSISMCHEKGHGTPRDLHEALFWARKDQDGFTSWSLLQRWFN
ncbi:5582_t:CDS:2 [Ambispora leptoticha]|uniref:5582_t:CDS:1 n=1 Tax=Ambispora leptoticha TaxID=144679 RepID=A0A9N9G8E0_9GLOM|nr:5582_t:CDS:2 [Ambispora leptoticha]